ncbi:hypothetical protein ACS0TY_022828 [Phlomoides rotata]
MRRVTNKHKLLHTSPKMLKRHAQIILRLTVRRSHARVPLDRKFEKRERVRNKVEGGERKGKGWVGTYPI